VKGAGGRQRCQLFTASSSQCCAPGKAEVHVAAELGGESMQFVVAEFDSPQLCASNERSGGVGGASCHPAGDRDVFIDVDVRSERRVGCSAPELLRQQSGGTPSKVRLIRGHLRSAPSGDAEPEHRTRRDGDLVEKVNSLEDGDQFVVPIGANWSDVQEKIDLCWYPHMYMGECGIGHAGILVGYTGCLGEGLFTAFVQLTFRLSGPNPMSVIDAVSFNRRASSTR